MQTLLTIKQQHDFFHDNNQQRTLVHKWSTRGYGNSKILDGAGNVLGKAGGCGYDRYGAALGNAMAKLFPKEILKLAKRECKGKRLNYKKSEKFYGLFYNSKTKTAWLDGGCGSQCMVKILNKIGFGLDYVGESGKTYNGEQFYTLRPVSKNERHWLSH